MTQSADDHAASASDVPVLSYSIPRPGKTVTVSWCADSIEAAVGANALEAAGIFCTVLNESVNNLGAPYSGFTKVEIQVHEEDAERATEILHANPDDWEPASDSDEPAPLDDDGRPLKLVEAARYDSVGKLRSAQIVLAASRLRSFAPALVRRGDHPAGAGDRFVLRVRQEDARRAEELLEQSRADDDEDDEPRCPKCHSWRVYPVGTFWRSLGAAFGLCRRPDKQIECLACRHRGTPGEFGMDG